MIVFCAVGAAQTTRPASSDGPAATVAAFRRAMDGINPGDVSNLLVADDANGRAVITEIKGLAVSLSHLRAALEAQFGPRASAFLNHPKTPLSEKINGDTAVVTAADGKETHLRRENGRWRIVVISSNVDASEEHIAELHVLTEAIDNITADTRAKRFDNAEEAARATEEELLQGRKIRHQATLPATSYVK